MDAKEIFVRRLANYCYYDFDSLEDCETCHRKDKCWKETRKLVEKEEETS